MTPFIKKTLAAAFALVGLAASSAHGDIIVTYQDVNDDLKFSWSGSLNLNGGGSTPGTLGKIATGASSSSSTHQYFYGFTGSYSFFQGNSFTRDPAPNNDWIFGNEADFVFTAAGNPTGDSFGISFLKSNDTATIFLPASYVSGTNISGSMTFAQQSVSALGLFPVSFTLGGSDGKITFQAPQVQGSAVPEPTTLALCSVAAAGLGMAGKRRRAR